MSKARPFYDYLPHAKDAERMSLEQRILMQNGFKYSVRLKIAETINMTSQCVVQIDLENREFTRLFGKALEEVLPSTIKELEVQGYSVKRLNGSEVGMHVDLLEISWGEGPWEE